MKKLQGKELIELLKEDPLLRYKELRSEDVVSLFLATRNPRKTALRRTKPNIRRYVLRFFEDGINAYQYLFDNASIYYTATAVEMGLLFKLRNKIKQAKQANPKLKNIHFHWLIENSNLDDNTKKLAHDIRIMRNCHIHYQNIIAYYAKQQDEYKDLIKQGILRPEAANLLSRDKENVPVRIEHLETKTEEMSLINKRIEEHINQVGSAISRLDKFKKRNNDTTILKLDELLLVYGVEALDALTCIRWSFKVLKALYII